MRLFPGLGLCLALTSNGFAAVPQEETDLKFAFYSSAWGANTNDGLRLVGQNQTTAPLRLNAITFLDAVDGEEQTRLPLSLEVPAGGYADIEFEYIDLVSGDECVDRTLQENWRLVEISNYTLNPSVRNLIIENTDSFRIYQCVKTVFTDWTDLRSNEEHRYEEWVLYHFETKRNF
jgi:hypothetical protein